MATIFLCQRLPYSSFLISSLCFSLGAPFAMSHNASPNHVVFSVSAWWDLLPTNFLSGLSHTRVSLCQWRHLNKSQDAGYLPLSQKPAQGSEGGTRTFWAQSKCCIQSYRCVKSQSWQEEGLGLMANIHGHYCILIVQVMYIMYCSLTQCFGKSHLQIILLWFDIIDFSMKSCQHLLVRQLSPQISAFLAHPKYKMSISDTVVRTTSQTFVL